MNIQKHRLSFLFILIFIAVSFLCIQSSTKTQTNSIHSSLLEKYFEKSDDQERISYRNKNGEITIAADVGYAIRTITTVPGGKLEEYFDEKGNPICLPNRYYAVFREYDKQERNIRVTFLDIDREPTSNIYGYATIEYDYDLSGKKEAEYYFDKNQVHTCSNLFGYGKKIEYDDNGNVKKITYIDEDGEPMMTGSGYAIMTRTYYNEGINSDKVKEEYYYDDKGNPISLHLGQYGLYKEYNELGQNTIITFLDEKGNPTVTSKGYSTISRTYNNDNTIASERYYDQKGNPFRLPEGQYGRKIGNGQEQYLNADGSEQINLKKLLYNQSEYVIIFALLVVLITALIPQKINILLFGLYVFVIIYMTILFRESNNAGETELLWYYRNILNNPNARADVLKNIWLFIPFGAILFQLYPKKNILIVPIILSIAIESIQYFMSIGYCELDDIISNSLGGWIGFETERLITELILRNKQQTCSLYE